MRKQNIFFWSDNPDAPVRTAYFLHHFRKILNTIGISYDEQEKRYLDFHGWRHFYNSNIRGSVPDEILRKFIGYKTEAMTDKYDHITLEQRQMMFKAMKTKILPFVKKAI